MTIHLKMSLALLLSVISVGSTKAEMADTGAGEKRAQVCFACHGENGTSKTPGIPHLAGQDRAYIEKALNAYRGGEMRQDPTMTSMAKSLSDTDIANIAAYFSSLPRDRN
jgi:cytochrome c553